MSSIRKSRIAQRDDAVMELLAVIKSVDESQVEGNLIEGLVPEGDMPRRTSAKVVGDRYLVIATIGGYSRSGPSINVFEIEDALQILASAQIAVQAGEFDSLTEAMLDSELVN